MKEEPLDFKLVEMLNTPICKMDGKDLIYLIKAVLCNQLEDPPVNSKEKAALYETGSRGLRHLIFNSQSTMQHFLESHQDVINDWLIHGDSIVWRNNKCFGNDNCITHGGSHMLELLVPLVTIKR